MKKLLSLLAAAVLFPVAANADVLSNVNLTGEIQTIASDVRHQVPGKDHFFNSGTKMRAMAGVSADLVEDVTANVLFQYAYKWGDNNEYGFHDGSDVRLVNANVVLHNLFCCLEATVGRQFYGDESSAVMYIGPSHYNAEGLGYAPALDAAKLAYGDDFKTFTVVAGRIVDMDDDTYADDFVNIDKLEATLMGADLKLNLTDTVTAQVYGYNVNDIKLEDDTGVEYRVDGNTGFYGAKLAFAPEAFRVSAEYARNYGVRHDLFKEDGSHTGHMVKADIAADIEAVTARGTFLYANENFWAFGNYTPGLIVGQKLGGDIFDFTTDGVRMFNLGFDVKPAAKWTVSLDGFAFQSSRGKHSATWEGDLTAKYAHNDYVELFAGIGYAKYGNEDSDFSKAAADRKDNVKGQLGMLIKF